jgi:hypothetical protein
MNLKLACSPGRLMKRQWLAAEKFDYPGEWEIIKTDQMSKKELKNEK